MNNKKKYSGGMFPLPLNLYKPYNININNITNTLTITPLDKEIIVREEKSTDKTIIIIDNNKVAYTHGNITRTTKTISNRTGKTTISNNTIKTNNSIITYKSNSKWHDQQSKPATPLKLSKSLIPPLTNITKNLDKLLQKLKLIKSNNIYDFKQITTFTKQIDNYKFIIITQNINPKVYYLIGTKSRKYLDKLLNNANIKDNINLLPNVNSEFKKLVYTQYLVDSINDKLSIHYVKTSTFPIALKNFAINVTL